jgi:replicative DNA helicase
MPKTNLSEFNLPSNQEVEKQAIVNLLCNFDYLEDYPDLSLEYFTASEYRCIYQALTSLHKEFGTYDVMSVVDFLEKQERLVQAGGKQLLLNLYAFVGDVNIGSQVEILADYAFRRNLILKGRNILQLGLDLRLPQESLKEQVKSEIDLLLDSQSTIALELVAKVGDRIDQYIQRGTAKGIPTGLSLLDRLIGGFKPAKVYVLGARTGMGKTAISVFFSLQLAKNQPEKFPVLFLSAEMSLESLGIRFIANISKVNSSSIANNYMSYEEQDLYRDGLEQFKKLNLIIDESPAQSLDSQAISDRLRSVAKTYGGVGAVVIDYVQLLGSLLTPRRDLAIGEVIRTCKDLSKKYKVPFLVLAQVRREVEARSNKRPALSDLKDSGTLEQAADAIFFLYRDDYYNEYSDTPGVTELIVAKHRDGATGTVSLDHDLGTCHYQEVNKSFSVILKSATPL